MKTPLLFFCLLASSCTGQAVQQQPYEDPYVKLMHLADVGKWDEELPLAERLTKENPYHPDAWLALGWGYKYTKSYDQAITAFERAIQLGAWRRPNLLIEIATCMAAKGDKSGALKTIESALESGYPYRNHIRGNRFFETLKDEAEFKKLTAQVDASELSRDEKWRHDISFLVSEIRRIHINPYKKLSAKDLEERRLELANSVTKLNDNQIVAELMKLGADLGDGHSGLELPYYQAESYDALPVLIGHFEDGIYVTAATTETEPLLWGQVLRVNGRSIDEVMTQLAAITPKDNEVRFKAISPSYIRYPKLLAGLGLAKDEKTVELQVKTRSGDNKTVKLESVQKPTSGWIRNPSDGSGRQPSYAEKRSDLYWFEHQPGQKLVYFQYNGVGNKEEESIESFSKRLFDFIEKNEVQRLVVDLRFNGGGNNFLNKPLLAGIISSRVNKPGDLFVIAGRHTFSAAIIFAQQLERYTHATFVGEPTGSSPNFVGETVMITLPCTGLSFSISNLYWQTSHAMDERLFIPPKLYVPYLFEDWKSGRDASMERIRSFVKEQG